MVLLHARDGSTELARLKFADRFDRYARLAPEGEVVSGAKFEVRRLTELLKALGVRECHRRSRRVVAVEVALEGSDADRLAGTQVFDKQKAWLTPAGVAASAAPITAYVDAHVDVTGTDGTPCARGAAEVVADGGGVIVRNQCRSRSRLPFDVLTSTGPDRVA